VPESAEGVAMEVIDWGYAISTLVIRFVGIFIVLGVLQVIMQITGRVFTRLDVKKDLKSQNTCAPSEGLTQEEAAAVGAALYLYERR
jgi:Na+-transporting methylmalonyl-CoA/oxaloacetate decarboxylase gamma subunit